MISKEHIMMNAKKGLKFLPDRTYIKLYHRLRVGKKINAKRPRTFNEKLQWLKFNYRFPLQSVVSDKLLVRGYVKEKIGEEYLIPLLGVWNSFDEIDFHKLPNSFVLKCNHDSGGLVVCKNKKNLDIKAARKKIIKSLKSNFYHVGREYQYKNIKPRIICEAFLSDKGNVPDDYKIYCFNGKPDSVLVCKDRFRNNSHRASYYFYDLEWNFLPLNKGDDINNPPHISKPENFDKMIEIAKELSKDFYFARIDLYNIDGKIYFGEVTLSPNSGFDPDIKESTDYEFGKKLKIPYWNMIDTKI